MRLQSLMILTTVSKRVAVSVTVAIAMTVALVTALIFVAPLNASPLAQTDVDETGDETSDEATDDLVEEVLVTSETAFTLTVRLDEVTTFAIPLQVNWRAEGPNEGRSDEVLVTISPTVLQRGFFSVTVGSVQPTTGTLTLVLAQPEEDDEPLTGTSTSTGTGTTVVTATNTTTTTLPTTPTVGGPTANSISNLRAGPSTDFAIVGTAQPGDALDVVGQNADGSWLVLSNGAWIAVFLVDNVPTGLPVVEPAATPLPTLAPTDAITPTLTPIIVPTATPELIITATPTP